MIMPVKIKFNRSMGLEIHGLGTFKPGEFVVVGNEEKAQKYIKSGYFDLVKEKVKEKKKVIKKYRKKGSDKNRKNTLE